MMTDTSQGCRKQIMIGQAKSACTMIWLDVAYIAMYQSSVDSNHMQDHVT